LQLVLLHPEVAAVSCEDCQTWMYDDGWEKETRYGLPVLRPEGAPTPCWSCPKIPKGAPPKPSSAVELSDKNVRAYLHYKECKAVGRFPDDPIVTRNARIIAGAEESVKESRQMEGQRQALMGILAALGGRIKSG
jgi:hypothetical protein